jgi:hypothetical protein
MLESIMARKLTPTPARKPSGGSWTALLAATTLGVAGASTVHAEVRSNAQLDEGRRYRLIVQSYDRGIGDTVGTHERPIASTQRAVTPAELRDGVRVGLLELRQSTKESNDITIPNLAKTLVLAWVEEGKADLEFDGLRARPQPGSITGTASRSGRENAVQISVSDQG